MDLFDPINIEYNSKQFTSHLHLFDKFQKCWVNFKQQPKHVKSIN